MINPPCCDYCKQPITEGQISLLSYGGRTFFLHAQAENPPQTRKPEPFPSPDCNLTYVLLYRTPPLHALTLDFSEFEKLVNTRAGELKLASRFTSRN